MSELDKERKEEKERRKIAMNHLFENRFRELKVYLENISKNEQNINYLEKVIKKSKQRHLNALNNRIKGRLTEKVAGRLAIPKDDDKQRPFTDYSEIAP